jgi:hypothetical protein
MHKDEHGHARTYSIEADSPERAAMLLLNTLGIWHSGTWHAESQSYEFVGYDISLVSKTVDGQVVVSRNGSTIWRRMFWIAYEAFQHQRTTTIIAWEKIASASQEP